MATFISLVTFTDQGIRDIKDSPARFEAFKAAAEKMGLSVKGVYYTTGRYDMVTILEGDEDAAVAALVKVGSRGNIRTETMRGRSVEEMKAIVEQVWT